MDSMCLLERASDLETHSWLNLIVDRNSHIAAATNQRERRKIDLQNSGILVVQNILIADRIIENAVVLGHNHLVPHNHVV